MDAYGKVKIMRVYLVCVLILCALSEHGWCAEKTADLSPATPHALALALHAIVLPVVHLVPQDGCVRWVKSASPSPFSNSATFVIDSVYSNQPCFAIHARNITALELVDLICYLTESSYAFRENTLMISTNDLKGVRHTLGQNEQRAATLVEKMKKQVLPEVSFRAPATILDAVEFFYSASFDYDEDKKGINFAVKNVQGLLKYRQKNNTNDVPIIAMSAKFCTLHEAVSNVCEVIGARIEIRNNTVIFVPNDAAAKH